MIPVRKGSDPIPLTNPKILTEKMKRDYAEITALLKNPNTISNELISKAMEIFDSIKDCEFDLKKLKQEHCLRNFEASKKSCSELIQSCFETLNGALPDAPLKFRRSSRSDWIQKLPALKDIGKIEPEKPEESPFTPLSAQRSPELIFQFDP